MKGKVVMDINNLARFYSDNDKQRIKYTAVGDDTKVNMETPMLPMIPAGLVEWLLAAPQTLWVLH